VAWRFNGVMSSPISLNSASTSAGTPLTPIVGVSV
jgi:hypothetical protein